MKEFLANLSGETYSSLIVVFVLGILLIAMGNKLKKSDPLKPTKGLAFLGELLFTFVDDFVEKNMGKRYEKLKPYFMVLVLMVPGYFLVGLFGLKSPMTRYSIPFTIALITFILIHLNSIRFTKWGYFKRFVEPFPKFPVFLPINIISMFAPLISLSFRMFGNAMAGTIIMQLLYWVTEKVTFSITNIGGLNFLGPILAPVLHAYFDVFSAVIQTLVFVYLTCFFIKGEESEEIEKQVI